MVSRAFADRGMASAANLAWLRQTGRRYIIGAPKSELKRFSSELAAADGWRTVQEGVEVKLTHYSETGETAILCRSADRGSKERAMHDKFSRRIEAALERLAARIARSKKRLDPTAVNRQIGRILQQNQRAAARFAIALEPDGCPAGFRLRIDYSASFDHWAALSEGAYLLRSNISDWSDRQLWKAYIQLTQAEAAFRIQKDQLNVRPIWHQREDRAQAHILVCFLAFVLWKVTAQVVDLVQNRRREFARDVGSPVRASMMAQPCFLAVDRNERMSAKSMAPSIERNPPEIFWRNFIMRPSRSA